VTCTSEQREYLVGARLFTPVQTCPGACLDEIHNPLMTLPMTIHNTDEIHDPVMTLKTVGHQWYWRYKYSDFTKLEFDSYIVQKEDLQTNTYTMGTGSFPEIKWPQRSVDQLPTSSAEVKGGVELHIYFPSGPSVACSSWNLLSPLGT